MPRSSIGSYRNALSKLHRRGKKNSEIRAGYSEQYTSLATKRAAARRQLGGAEARNYATGWSR